MMLEESGSKLFTIIDLPDEDSARALCSRSVLIKAIYELWGIGSSLEEAVEATKRAYDSGRNIDMSLFGEENSWCINVQLLYKKVPSEEKEKHRVQFKFLDFRGPVQLGEPDVNVTVILDYFQDYSSRENSNHTVESKISSHSAPAYCGRVLARGGMREELRKYDLKKRLYLGPTTLDHSLALLMANLRGVKSGHLCLDPLLAQRHCW